MKKALHHLRTFEAWFNNRFGWFFSPNKYR